MEHKMPERRRRTHLRPREVQTLRLIVEGLEDKEIATALGVAPNSVKVYVRGILDVLQVRNRIQAAVHAVRNPEVLETGRDLRRADPSAEEAAIRGVLESGRYVTRGAIRRATGLSSYTIRNVLDRLGGQGVVESTGAGHERQFRLVEVPVRELEDA